MMVKRSWRIKVVPKQLHLQVGFIVSALLLTTIGVYAWHTAREQSEASLDAIKSRTTVMARSIANLSMHYLLTEDIASIRILLLKMAEFPNVQSISLINKEGSVLSQVVHADNSAPRVRYGLEPLKPPAGENPAILTGDGRLVVWHPIADGHLFGWVKIDYSLQAIAAFQRHIWNDSFIAALLCVASSITFIMLLLNRPLREVRKLTDFAKGLIEKRGAKVEVKDNSSEIEQLASALNATSTALFEQDRSLKESADHLEQLRRQNALILESAGEGILRLDKEGNITFVNPAAERMLGYELGELIGRPAHETLHYRKPDGTSYHENECPTYATLKDGQIHHTSDELFWRKDGASFPVEYTATPIREGGRVMGAVVTFKDITERKQAEEALRQSEEFLNSIVENIPAMIFVKDAANLRFVRFNRAAEELLGYSREEMLGKNDHDFFPAREADFFTGKDREVLRNNVPVEIPEETIQTRRHGERILYTKKMPILDKKGNPRYLLGISEDITERKLSERKIEKQVKRLAALRDIDAAITSSLDLRISTTVILREIINQLAVDAADILLFNPATQTLEYADGRGFRTGALRHTRLRLGESYAGRSALERRIVHIQNVSAGDNDFVRSPLLAQEGFADYFGVPLISKGQIRGVLEIFHRTVLHPDQEWLDFLEALGAQAAIAVDNAVMFNDVERSNTELVLAYESTLEGWSRALDYRDKETEGHSKRVTDITVTIARAMGLNDDELVNVRRGALLHDIGKLGVPDNILLKPGKLTDEEWTIMKKHPAIAHDLLSPIPFLKKALDIPYCHHEKWNGAGYPRGLKGEEIPLAARIFSVVDVWDALRSDRPYRPAWSKEKTMEYILQEVGAAFDPKVVEAFISAVKSESA